MSKNNRRGRGNRSAKPETNVNGYPKPSGKPAGVGYDQGTKPNEGKSSFGRFFEKVASLESDNFTLGFNRPLGDSFRMFRDAYYVSPQPTHPAYKNLLEPGLLVLEVRFNPGTSTTAYSAPNVAALNTFTKIRKDGNGAKNYEPADIMLHLMTMDTVYVWYENLKRIYGIINKGFSAYTRYQPKAVVEALGFDYDDIKNKLPAFRTVINTFVKKLNTFFIPDNGYFAWHRELFSELYSDSTDVRAQLYAFKPDGLYEYVETEGAGYLKYHSWGWLPNTTETVSKYNLTHIEQICDFIMTHVVAIEDIGVMNGDIERAYGDNTFKLDELNPDHTVDVWFDEAMLNAIANADVQALPKDETADITQDVSIGAGGLIYNIEPSEMNAYNDSILKFINMYNDLTSPNEVLMATRFMCGYDGNYFVHGTEVITSMRIVSMVPNNYPGPPTNQWESYDVTNTFTLSAGVALNALNLLTAFDYAPKLVYGGANAGGKITNAKETGMFIETNCYDLFSPSTLSKMHDVAIIGLWDI